MKIQKTQKHCPIPSGNIVAAGAAVVSNSPGQVSRVIGRRLAGQRSIPEELPGTTGALCTIPLCIRVAPPILRAAGYVTQPWCHTGHQLVLIEGKGLLFPCILLIILQNQWGNAAVMEPTVSPCLPRDTAAPEQPESLTRTPQTLSSCAAHQSAALPPREKPPTEIRAGSMPGCFTSRSTTQLIPKAQMSRVPHASAGSASVLSPKSFASGPGYCAASSGCNALA